MLKHPIIMLIALAKKYLYPQNPLPSHLIQNSPSWLLANTPPINFPCKTTVM